MSFLEAHERYVFETASEDGVVQGATRLKTGPMRRKRWLATRNAYIANAQSRLDKDAKPDGTPHQADLGEYLAASAMVHVGDGWSYLSRALQAHLAGDPDAARHLAYYAELRAAFSILSSQGIGIFDRRQAVIDSHGEVKLLRGKPTHEVTWLALKFWAGSGGGSYVLGQIIQPASVPLETWVAALPNVGGWGAVGLQWLLTWGLDLELFATDRQSRNRASYDPTRLAARTALAPQEATDFVEEIWRALEPAPSDSFHTLDRHLLRLALENAFVGNTSSASRRPRAADPAWQAAVTAAVDQAIGVGSSDVLKQFLLRQIDSDDLPVLALTKGTVAVSNAIHHIQVIARAAMLLRVASGCCRRMLTAAGVSIDELDFWIDPIGVDRGIWSPGGLPADRTELWVDIENALADVSSHFHAPSAPSSYRELFDLAAAPLRTLTTAERIPAWAFA